MPTHSVAELVDQLNAMVAPKEVACIAVLPNTDSLKSGARAKIKNLFRNPSIWETDVPGIRMLKPGDFNQQIGSLWYMSECAKDTEWNAFIGLKSKTMTVDYSMNWRNYRKKWCTGHVSARR
jgi:hypothetical protein